MKPFSYVEALFIPPKYDGGQIREIIWTNKGIIRSITIVTSRKNTELFSFFIYIHHIIGDTCVLYVRETCFKLHRITKLRLKS